MEKAKEKYEDMNETYETLLKMFVREVRQKALEKDECYGCDYSKRGPCIGTCYKKLEASRRGNGCE